MSHQGKDVVSVGIAMPKDLALKARVVAAGQDKSRSALITEILEAALRNLDIGEIMKEVNKHDQAGAT